RTWRNDPPGEVHLKSERMSHVFLSDKPNSAIAFPKFLLSWPGLDNLTRAKRCRTLSLLHCSGLISWPDWRNLSLTVRGMQSSLFQSAFAATDRMDSGSLEYFLPNVSNTFLYSFCSRVLLQERAASSVLSAVLSLLHILSGSLIPTVSSLRRTTMGMHRRLSSIKSSSKRKYSISVAFIMLP